IKTGNTSDAGGCLLFAVSRVPRGANRPVVMLGVVLGQTDLPQALHVAAASTQAAYEGYVDTADLHPAISGQVTTAWG
ncbi:hypothetical protein, partial [Salmonella sp. SAL04284]|uniref:hypothetical protein n=1 Tax=Salmonella sp. SAL04284 TaxID=3159862 RepID=UPI00397BBC62